MSGSSPSHRGSTDLSDAAWAAGFLEGEGHFRLRQYGQHTTPAVTATQKDLQPLRRLKRLFGGHIYVRDVSVWIAYGHLARRVMRTVRPWLSRRRRQQMKAALAHVIQPVGRPRV